MGLTVLDAGVVIGALDASDAHHAAVTDALAGLRSRGDTLVLPASAYAEVLVHPARRGSATVARVDSALDALGIEIAAADRDIARRAALLRGRHDALRLPDALVIATAGALDADELVTTDHRWKKARGLDWRGHLSVVT
jgi:predicted nucleic acid-binding protein